MFRELFPHARASRLVLRSTHQDNAQPQAVPHATAGRGRCHGMDLQPSRKPGEYCSPTSSAVNFVEQRQAIYRGTSQYPPQGRGVTSDTIVYLGNDDVHYVWLAPTAPSVRISTLPEACAK